MRNIVMALRNHPAVDVGPDTLAVSAFENAARYARKGKRGEGIRGTSVCDAREFESL